ncbi:MAG: hypothetical protein LBR16_01740 [Treponema sp.]|jgi:hypothetical protein|nr:hypothetical protein [Treponema sp.]
MNTNLLTAIKALAAKGADVFSDLKRVDESLPVFANKEAAAERRAFLAVLASGLPAKLRETKDTAARASLVNRAAHSLSGANEAPPALAREIAALVEALCPAKSAAASPPAPPVPPRQVPAAGAPLPQSPEAAKPPARALRLSRKTVFFALAATGGGLVTESICECIPWFNQHGGTFWSVIVETAVWFGVIALGLIACLLAAQSGYLKKPPSAPTVVKAVLLGVLSGAAAGGLAQAVFAYTSQISTAVEIVSRILCWGFAGAGVGLGTSFFVPNYPIKRSLPAGLVGGLLGGVLFRASFGIMPEGIARVVSIAILGLCIGATIAIAEEILREAWITVDWGHNERVNVTLGTRPVVLGSAPEADIFLSRQNYPAVALVVSIDGQKVIVDNKLNGQRTEMANGSELSLGTVKVTVHKR